METLPVGVNSYADVRALFVQTPVSYVVYNVVVGEPVPLPLFKVIVV